MSVYWICLCWKLFEFWSFVRFVKLSYELELTWMGLRWLGYPHLSSSQCLFDRLFLTKHCRCFSKDTKGADGAADLLEALSHSPLLEELDLAYCSQIPAGAWQKVRSAKWLHLKAANFRLCLAERNGWRMMLKVFFSAARICLCLKLFEFRSIVRMMKLSYELELTWMGLRWIGYPHLSSSQCLFDRLFLTKHCRCFDEDTKDADGAADLLEALSHSPLLEELDFTGCNQIPAGAWQKVRSAKWLHLKAANFRLCLAERNGWRMMLKVSFLRRAFVSVWSCSSLGASPEWWSCHMSRSWPRRV